MRALVLLLAVACGPPGGEWNDRADDPYGVTDTDTAPGPFRVALLADPHVIGDDYSGKEGNALDTESIYKTQARFRATLDLLRDVEPAPDFGLIAGDVFHAGYKSDPTLADLLDPAKGLAPVRAKEILDTSPIPLDLAWGNHDYPGPGEGRELAHAVFDQLFGTAPYHARVHKGWRFVYLNTQLGPSWDPEDPMNAFLDRGGGSLGREQLAWLAEQLDAGQPTILVMHHHPLAETLLKGEDPDGPWPDVFAVIEAYNDVVKGAFFGHFHRWFDVAGQLGVPSWIIGGIRYDADNFWVAEMEEDGSDWQILDYDKAEWGTVNGLSTSYEGGEVAVDTETPAGFDPAFPDE
ncbi:MAG: metallophosphoesterase [Alphaproteobacteria bacterium]|nr:metallophosphoesterase [Alphaproteobacteria bacterium]